MISITAFYNGGVRRVYVGESLPSLMELVEPGWRGVLVRDVEVVVPGCSSVDPSPDRGGLMEEGSGEVVLAFDGNA